MTIQDVFANWLASVQRAPAAQLSSENSTQDELLQGTGLDVHVRTNFRAGSTPGIEITHVTECGGLQGQ